MKKEGDTILVIDDETQIQTLLRITFESNGYKVEKALNGNDGIIKAAGTMPDLILLDLGLPDINGHKLLLNLRSWFKKPILILSVQNNEGDIVKALDNGANDYLTKPFRSAELLARVRAALRSATKSDAPAIIQNDQLEINLVKRTVKKNGEILKLTATEFNLLTILAEAEGMVLTHRYLLEHIWGPSYLNETQYLRVFIGQLRKKIEDDPNRPKYIVTEPRVGYRFIIERRKK